MDGHIELIWHDSGAMEFRARCGACRYESPLCEDEDAARAAWFGHVCVRARSSMSA